MLFTKAKKAIGLDMGTHSVKAVQMSRSGGRLCVDEVGYALLDRNELNNNPAGAHASAVVEALRPMNVANSLVVAALPGQTAVIRYPRLNESARDDMERAIEHEAGQSIPYDLSEVFLDWVLLDEIEEGEQRQLKVLLVAAKHEVIDSRVQTLEAADVQCGVLDVDSLALADAAEGCGFLQQGETVALINIGLTSASIHFVKDGLSNFIRDVNWGARELIQALAKDRRCDYDEAERLLREAVVGGEASAEDMPEAVEAVEEPPEAFEGSPSEQVEEDPFGELGGGSLLDPLDDELGGADETPGPMPHPPQGVPGAAAPTEHDVGEVLSQPLTRMVSEIRRSFDFYEHQLYERPVDRILLSGGVAHLPFVRKTLREELGMDTVEVADPSTGGLVLGDDIAMAELLERPAQFMVAVGLAARGVAEL